MTENFQAANDPSTGSLNDPTFEESKGEPSIDNPRRAGSNEAFGPLKIVIEHCVNCR